VAVAPVQLSWLHNEAKRIRVIGNDVQYWISLAITCCAGLGLWSLFQIIFPPKLECGDADFVALNLRDNLAAPSEKKKPDEQGEPDLK
jgi:hypothetical protein